MKIAFCGDLHLEFGGADFELPDADVLLLAGDICVIEHLQNLHSYEYDVCAQFFKDVSEKYERVIYIPGNHEFYGGVIGRPRYDVVTNFLNMLKLENVVYAYQYRVKIDDVLIVAATLWTDFNKGNPDIMNLAQRGMSDYREIMIQDATLDSGLRYITATDILNHHNRHIDYIKDQLLVDSGKVVVMTHHAPNLLSAGGNGRSNLDYAFCCTDVDDLILDNPQIKYWVHGHVHTRREYKIGETTVISNCRGYKNYEDTNSFEIKIIEV